MPSYIKYSFAQHLNLDNYNGGFEYIGGDVDKVDNRSGINE